jgi:hypothetical protein
MGVREYDPALGRFVSADPLKGDPTDPQQRNRYIYTSNNPLVRYDLNGETWYKPWTWFDDEEDGTCSGENRTVLPPCHSDFQELAMDEFSDVDTALFNDNADLSDRMFSAAMVGLTFDSGGLGKKCGKKIAKSFTKSQVRQFEKQLLEHGVESLYKSRRSLEKRLLEHKEKLKEIEEVGGYTSSVEREIRNLE